MEVSPLGFTATNFLTISFSTKQTYFKFITSREAISHNYHACRHSPDWRSALVVLGENDVGIIGVT